MKRFEIIDHPSDVGIIAYGKDLKELFGNAAFGMFSLIGDVAKVGSKIEHTFRITGDDRESLLINWLNELLFVEDARKTMFVDFQITNLTETSLNAEARGEVIDPSRHIIKQSVKAATYNQLKIKKENALWTAKIIFDI